MDPDHRRNGPTDDTHLGRQVQSDDDQSRQSRRNHHVRRSSGGSQGKNHSHADLDSIEPSDSASHASPRHRRRDYLASYVPMIPSYYRTAPPVDQESPSAAQHGPISPVEQHDLSSTAPPEPVAGSGETQAGILSQGVQGPGVHTARVQPVTFGNLGTLNDTHPAFRLPITPMKSPDAPAQRPSLPQTRSLTSSMQPQAGVSRASTSSTGGGRLFGRSTPDSRSRRTSKIRATSPIIQPRKSSAKLIPDALQLSDNVGPQVVPRKESSLPSIREHSNARPVRVTSDDQHLLAVTSGSRAASQWSATTEDMMNRYGVRWLERILASSNELIARRDREALLTAQGQRQNLAPKSSAPPEIGSSSPESEIAEVLPEASEKRFEGLIADLERLLNEALIMARAAEERDPTDLDPQVTSTAPHVTYEEPEGLDSGFREFGKLTGERLATPWAQDMRTHRDPVRQQPARHQIEPLQAPVVKSTGLSRRTPRTQSLQVDTQTDPLAVTLSKDQIPLGTSRVDYATATGSDSPGKLTANDQYLEPARPMASELPRRSTEDHVVRNGKPQIEARGREAVEEQIELYHSSPMGPPTGHHQVKTIKPWEAKARAVALGRDYNGDTTIVYAVPEGAEPPEHSLAQSTSPPPTVKHENIPMTRMRESQYDRSSSTFRAGLGLSGRRHISLRGETPGFNLYRTSKQQPIARDWGRIRKHMVSIMACMGTSLIGLLIGIYAGEVPAIQYQIVDYNHNTLQGNVWLYMGMACSTLLFWPLSLLHGRKPYILLGLVLLIPLQFVQGLIARALTGVSLGFANINFKHILLDIWGASLQSSHPHQEVALSEDVRRRGGGMGIWLGLWTWSFIGSLGLGFLLGASIIDGTSPQWGFYLVSILAAAILMLYIITPEVRRSPFRRSITEVLQGARVSTRVARGEINLHVRQTGPRWWWEEVTAGLLLSAKMLVQPGFAIMALYCGWIYGQVIMIIVLLGALLSKYYQFRAVHTGLGVFAVGVGAMLAIPLLKAGIFSRARKGPPRTDSMTFQRRVTWSSHLVRRTTFMALLPATGIAYTIASGGPPTPFIVPILLASLIGFLSCLAIAECHGIIMETFDVSDIPPVVIRGGRRSSIDVSATKKNNYTCHPRVSAGFAVTQAFGFFIASVTTGVGGAVERNLGAQITTGVVASILVVLTLLLSAVLFRWCVVQVVPAVVPDKSVRDGDKDSNGEEDVVIIGNPSGKTRRLSILELGKLTRWTEIRTRNKLMEVPRYF